MIFVSETAVAQDRPDILFVWKECAGMKRTSLVFVLYVNGSSSSKEGEDRFWTTGNAGIVQRRPTVDILSVDEFFALFILLAMRWFETVID